MNRKSEYETNDIRVCTVAQSGIQIPGAANRDDVAVVNNVSSCGHKWMVHVKGAKKYGEYIYVVSDIHKGSPNPEPAALMKTNRRNILKANTRTVNWIT
mmetsp:Transcript_2557/g.3481  ORF Transcript_2557/g.3481 Transcript_2557/m.3481 type:complete len:99 (+) Transcript_2557:127-423(+)